VDGHQHGVIPLTEALNLARQHAVDLVEIAASAVPPVCRLVDFGKYRYEIAKKEKETKKHNHASIVKEVQLSPRIDPHDLGIKLTHAVDFLCEDMKVKIALKFRGREMAHTEVGFAVINKFLADIATYGHPDFPPKLIGRGINVMISPLPRNKRGKNPNQTENGKVSPAEKSDHGDSAPVQIKKPKPDSIGAKQPSATFGNNPFAKLDLNARQDSTPDSQG